MRVFSWNVNGLRACVRKGFGEWLREERPDIVCLNEVRALPEQLPEEIRDPEGYHAVWNPARRKWGHCRAARVLAHPTLKAPAAGSGLDGLIVRPGSGIAIVSCGTL